MLKCAAAGGGSLQLGRTSERGERPPMIKKKSLSAGAELPERAGTPSTSVVSTSGWAGVGQNWGYLPTVSLSMRFFSFLWC